MVVLYGIVSFICVTHSFYCVFRVGDILVSVNEKVVDGRTHGDAVNALKSAGMQARMVNIVFIVLCFDNAC